MYVKIILFHDSDLLVNRRVVQKLVLFKHIFFWRNMLDANLQMAYSY